MRRGHRVHVITRAVPGYPIDDEEYQGLFIHRWIRTWNRGPLFGLSFVSGVRRALRRLRGELDVIHTHQALWEAVATGLASPGRSGDSDAGAAGQLGLLRRGRRAPPHPGFKRPAADHPAEHGIRGHLGGDRAPVARARRSPRTGWSGPPAAWTPTISHPGPSQVEGELLPRPRVVFTGRLHPQKNLPLLLEAWARLPARPRPT